MIHKKAQMGDRQEIQSRVRDLLKDLRALNDQEANIYEKLKKLHGQSPQNDETRERIDDLEKLLNRIHENIIKTDEELAKSQREIEALESGESIPPEQISQLKREQAESRERQRLQEGARAKTERLSKEEAEAQKESDVVSKIEAERRLKNLERAEIGLHGRPGTASASSRRTAPIPVAPASPPVTAAASPDIRQVIESRIDDLQEEIRRLEERQVRVSAELEKLHGQSPQNDETREQIVSLNTLLNRIHDYIIARNKELTRFQSEEQEREQKLEELLRPQRARITAWKRKQAEAQERDEARRQTEFERQDEIRRRTEEQVRFRENAATDRKRQAEQAEQRRQDQEKMDRLKRDRQAEDKRLKEERVAAQKLAKEQQIDRANREREANKAQSQKEKDVESNIQAERRQKILEQAAGSPGAAAANPTLGTGSAGAAIPTPVAPASPPQAKRSSPSAISRFYERARAAVSPKPKPSSARVISSFLETPTLPVQDRRNVLRSRREQSAGTSAFPTRDELMDNITTDITFPQTRNQNLLPFTVVSQQLLKLDQSSDGFPQLEVGALGKIMNVDKLIEMITFMSNPEHFFARNMEIAFGVTDFKYFASQQGIEVINKLIEFPRKLKDWTKKMRSFSGGHLDEKKMRFIEETMIETIDLFSDFCKVSNSPAPICSNMKSFDDSEDNKARIKFFNDLDNQFDKTSFLKISFHDYVETFNLFSNVAEFMNIKIERSKQVTARLTDERIFDDLAMLNKLIPDAKISFTVFEIDKIIDVLNRMTTDLTSFFTSKSTSGTQEFDLINDVKDAIRILQQKKNKETGKVPWTGLGKDPETRDPTITTETWKTLFARLNIVINGTIDWSKGDAKPTNVKPVAALLVFMKTIMDFQEAKNLPDIFDKEKLIRLFPHGKAEVFYKSILTALTKVFKGLRAEAIDYDFIKRTVDNANEQVTPNVLASMFIEHFLQSNFVDPNFNFGIFGKNVYLNLKSGVEPPLTVVLVEAVINFISKIPTGVVVDEESAGKDVAQMSLSKDSINILRVLYANQIVPGVFEIGNQADLRQRVVDAKAKTSVK